MRFVFVILSFVLALVVNAQEVTGPVESVNTFLLKTQKLRASRGNPEPVLSNKSPLHLLVFLSPECPLCVNYTKVLNEMALSFNGKTEIIGIVPGKTYSVAQVDSFAKDYRIRFKLFIDPDKKITKSVRATVTPEAILFDNAGRIIYRGAIDDWAIAPGQKKIRASEEYLRNAIAAHLAGNRVVLQKTKPVGCLINDY